jgi:hypothetical protein
MPGLWEHGTAPVPRTGAFSGVPLSELPRLLYAADRYGLRENPTTTVCRDLKTRQRPYVATYEAMINAKRVTPALICRMYFGTLSAHTNDT